MAILSGVPVDQVGKTVQGIIDRAEAAKILVSLDEKGTFTVETR
jgi:hypothetical protein